MTDIRARLADALRGKHPWFAINGHDYDTADILLSLPGIAIVELPELAEESFASQYWITFHPDGVRWTNDKLGATTDETREFAAALLAAASAAEATP